MQVKKQSKKCMSQSVQTIQNWAQIMVDIYKNVKMNFTYIKELKATLQNLNHCCRDGHCG